MLFLVHNSSKERKEKQRKFNENNLFSFLVRLSPLKINLLCYQTNTLTKSCALSISMIQ